MLATATATVARECAIAAMIAEKAATALRMEVLLR